MDFFALCEQTYISLVYGFLLDFSPIFEVIDNLDWKFDSFNSSIISLVVTACDPTCNPSFILENPGQMISLDQMICQNPLVVKNQSADQSLLTSQPEKPMDPNSAILSQ